MMEPESRSQLSSYLKLFLNRKNRIQPFIGLGSIMECVNIDVQNTEALFLCEVCVCRLSKNDMQNHIVGSQHRFNYIKACHPHLLSKWQSNSDLPNLAWPLMELAKKLEVEEGPGDVQFLEVDDAIHRVMANQSESFVSFSVPYFGCSSFSKTAAIDLFNILRDEPVESETTSLHYSDASEGEVLSRCNPARKSRISFEMSSESSKDLLQVAAAEAPSFKSTILSQNESKQDVELMPTQKPSFYSSYSDSLLSEHNENKPTLGLGCVVQFRSEDGTTHGFLCHCCRIRSNENDVNDHVVSCSHLINYLTETHSEEMEEISENFEDNNELLHLAKRVEEIEGKGELEVIQIPEPHCWQLFGKSYHWCLKMLSGDWKNSSTENVNAGKGTYWNRTSFRPSAKFPTLAQKRRKRVKGKTKKKKIKTVFNVSLPLSKGEMLLQGRTPFGADNLLDSYSLHQSDYKPDPLPDSDSADCMLDYDSSVFTFALVKTSNFPTFQLQQDINQDQVDADLFSLEESSGTAFEYADGYNGIENNFVNRDWMSNRPHELYDLKGNDMPTQRMEVFPALTCNKDGSSYDFHSKQQSGVEDYNSASGGAVVSGQRNNRHICYNASNYYYQQPYLHRQMTWDNVNIQSTVMCGDLGMHDEASSYIYTSKTNMQLQSGSIIPHTGGRAAHFHNPDLSQMQTCTGFPFNHYEAVPHNYIPQPATYPNSYPDNRLTYSTNCNFGLCSNPVQRCADPTSFTSGGWTMMQPNAVIQPGQIMYQEAYCNRNYRDGGHVM